jgi:hypothetical protein
MIGGANFHYFRDNIGVKDQAEVEKREDVLVYTSLEQKEGLEIIGPLKVVTQTVYFSREYPSHVILHVVKKEE